MHTRWRHAVLAAVARWMLFAIAQSVPAAERVEWLREWRGELWQAGRACAVRPGRARDGLAPLRFAAGAFADARCLRGEVVRTRRLRVLSPGECLLTLLTVAFISVGAAAGSAKVCAEFRQMQWATAEDLSILFLPNVANEGRASVWPKQFRVWAEHSRFLRSIDYYQVTPRTITVDGRSATFRIAHGTAGLRSAMVRGGESTPPGSQEAAVVMTTRGWQQLTHGADGAVGRTVRVNGRAVRLAAIADVEDSGLPGEYDAWLFDDEPMDEGRAGFVVARHGFDMSTDWYFGYGHLGFRETPTTEVTALSFPVQQRKVSPWWALAVGLGFSLLALPATTPLGFGAHVRTRGRSTVRHLLRRWLYLVLKCLLLMLVASSAGLLLGSLFAEDRWRTTVEAQVLVSFAVFLLGMRWAVRDQRSRCPVCLMSLAHPANVGEASKTFLAWNGTELVCDRGHGMMHVPAHATSWFSGQRWLALDPSWRFLFVERRS